MKYFLTGIFGVIILIISTNNILACSPGPDWPPSNEENYFNNKVVFVGIVTQVVNKNKNEIDKLKIKFNVVKIYKGNIGNEVTITTAASEAICGYNQNAFIVGDIWAIYTSDELKTNNLMLNKKFLTVGEALKNMSVISGELKCLEGEGVCEKCGENIDPVCGEINTNIRCIKEPCPSVKYVTFKNKCLAERSNAKKIINGECKVILKVPTGNPIVNIKDNQIIKSPLIIKGNSKNVWFGFNGILGTVELISDSGNSFGKSKLNIIGNWMTEDSVEFESIIEFDANSEMKGKLVFKAENPSGEPRNDKSFIIPVQFESDVFNENNSLFKYFFEKILDFLKIIFR